MDIAAILQSKPLLIGLHLGFAIIGIDVFLWLLGQLKDRLSLRRSRTLTAAAGLGAFIASWLAGGYYYVVYYGSQVKPIIKSGLAPWAHNIAMETKEHIFLFIIPLAATAFLLARLEQQELEGLGLRSRAIWLCAFVAGLGLLIGALGFAVSAAARWGGI